MKRPESEDQSIVIQIPLALPISMRNLYDAYVEHMCAWLQ